MFDTLMTMVIVSFVHNEQQNVVSVRDNNDGEYTYIHIWKRKRLLTDNIDHDNNTATLIAK
jgi:hypothetical protein